MPLSTNQYGYIIDPLVPLTDDTGRTISNGYIRVFMAGTSTPVITYKNFDGATNEETVQLDNSGRTAYPVIGSKGSTYKVCVYDAEHSQETPIKTIDKVVPTGASVEATNIVTGLDNVESPEAGWVKSTVTGTDAEVSLDATNVTSEVDTMAKATAASADYMVPLVHKTGSDPDKKITLGNIFKFVLNHIHSLTGTATEADLTSGNYIPLDGSAGTKKLNSTTLLTKTAKNALGSIHSISDTATEFASDDYIAIDGATNGSRKMNKNYLLQKTTFASGAGVVDLKSLSLGQINITGSGWTWYQEIIASVNAVARLNEDVTLNLEEGDIITLTDFVNYKLNVGYTLDGGVTYSYSGYKNVPFVCTGDGRYVFNVSSNDGSTTHTIEEFASVVRVLSSNSSVSLVNTENRLNKDNSLIGRNFFKKLSVVGTGSMVIGPYFDAIPSTKLRIYIDNPNFAVTSIPNPTDSKLLVATIKNDGSSIQTKKFTRDQAIPDFFDIDVPSNEHRIRLQYRADVGESIDFVLEYRPLQFEDVDNNLQQLHSRKVDVRKLSLGNINITGNGLAWWAEVAGNVNAIARINEDVVLNLSEGDEISLTDFVNYKLNVGYTLDGGVTYLYSGYKNQKFICPGAGRYVFDISSNDGTTTHTIYEFANVLSIKSKNINAISVFSLDEDEEKKLEYLGFGNTHNFQITGTGNSWIYHRVKVAPNSKMRIRCDKPGWACTSVLSGKVLQLASVNNGGTPYENLGFYPSAGAPSVFDYLAQSDTYYIRFGVKADVGEVINFSVECVENKLNVSQGNRYIRSINHRGYNPIAPENTLPAFIMSARLGFNCVETDIQKTSDGYYVCIHDATVDRTSDGSGNVADMTLAQLKALDFGSWRNARYAGTKIPTFDEFLACCKKLGLHPYVELKAGFDELEKVAASVKAYGFEKDITFASYLLSALQQMKTLCPYARLGQVLTTIAEGDLANIAALKNGTNEVFLDYYNIAMDDSVAEDCIAAGIGLELWTCDTTAEIVEANGYVSGFTSDFIVAEQVLFDKESG